MSLCQRVVLLLLSFTLGAVAHAWQIEVVTVRPMATEDFQAFSELFTRRESPQGRLIVRTDPAVRDGRYFLTLLDQDSGSLPSGSLLVAEVITALDKEPRTIRWELPAGNGREIAAGLTGEQDPGEEVPVLAWRLRLVDGQGSVLAEKKSFLWEMP